MTNQQTKKSPLLTGVKLNEQCHYAGDICFNLNHPQRSKNDSFQAFIIRHSNYFLQLSGYFHYLRSNYTMQQIIINALWAVFALLNDAAATTALFNISLVVSHG